MTAMNASHATAVANTGDAPPQITTTSGYIAMVNLQAQIDGFEKRAAERLSVAEETGLIELVALRGHILGRITDYELAEERAEELCRKNPNDGTAHLARARSRARFHRFDEALGDLDTAERLGANPEPVDRERATIFQAIGQFDEAFTRFRCAETSENEFACSGTLAVFYAEQGNPEQAEEFFEKSQRAYRGVSPIPLALLEFQRGHMWMAQGNRDRARSWFQKAVDRLPEFAPAQGHLAEVEALCSETDSAITRLIPLTTSSDDPDYTAALARILQAVGRVEEGTRWRTKAAARYEELILGRRDAFVDHAAAFLLVQGGNPYRALELAQRNLEIRQTPRAKGLFERALRACETAAAAKPLFV
jgi:tetratricopeptide (TPR) repeat protein